MAEHEHPTAPSSGTGKVSKHVDWNETADRVVRGLEGAAATRAVTSDAGRPPGGAAKLVGTSGFAEANVDPMD